MKVSLCHLLQSYIDSPGQSHNLVLPTEPSDVLWPYDIDGTMLVRPGGKDGQHPGGFNNVHILYRVENKL